MGPPFCLTAVEAFGTIGLMSDRRIRLSDEDIELIVRALTARYAMLRGARAHRAIRLRNRLEEGGRGNPKWRLDEFEQTHEDELEEDELA